MTAMSVELVLADERRLDLALVPEGHAQLVRVLHDVRVGDDVARLVDHESRARALRLLLLLEAEQIGALLGDVRRDVDDGGRHPPVDLARRQRARVTAVVRGLGRGARRAGVGVVGRLQRRVERRLARAVVGEPPVRDDEAPDAAAETQQGDEQGDGADPRAGRDDARPARRSRASTRPSSAGRPARWRRRGWCPRCSCCRSCADSYPRLPVRRSPVHAPRGILSSARGTRATVRRMAARDGPGGEAALARGGRRGRCR